MVSLCVTTGKTSRFLPYADHKGAGKMPQFRSARGQEKYRRVGKVHSLGREVGGEFHGNEEANLIRDFTVRVLPGCSFRKDCKMLCCTKRDT